MIKKIKFFLLRIGIIGLKAIYIIIKLFPTSNKITFISRQSNNPSLDFSILQEELNKRYPQYKIVTLAKKIDNKVLYSFHMIKQMYHIATSKVVLLDSYCIVISLLHHKKSLKVIQMWHAAGAIKKFGYQSLDKKEGRGSKIARIMNMHKNYTHVIAPSHATAKFYQEAFNVSKDQIIINGLPRLDYILDKDLGKEKLKELCNQYHRFRNKTKKTILYVPTFRKDNDNVDKIKELIKAINFSKYNLVIKMHPLDKSEKINKYILDKKYNVYDLLKLADYVITDYSAVAFEASILNKPLYFYVYDIKEYKKVRGLNIDLFKEMNNSTSTNIKEIISSIENGKYDYNELENFRTKYIGKDYYNNTIKLVDFIFNYLNEDVTKNEENKNNINEHSKEELNV